MAPTDVEVLLSGPTGVGKELYACLLHRLSHRSAEAFVPVNCGALPSDLFENELFGHVGGAFTGARPRTEERRQHRPRRPPERQGAAGLLRADAEAMGEGGRESDQEGPKTLGTGVSVSPCTDRLDGIRP